LRRFFLWVLDGVCLLSWPANLILLLMYAPTIENISGADE
jgi:hypothetical protein